MQKSKKGSGLGKSDLLKRKAEEKLRLCGKTDEALILLFMTEIDGKEEKFGLNEIFELMRGLLVLPAKFIVIDNDRPSDDVFKNGKLHWINFEGESGKGKQVELETVLLAADAGVFFDSGEKIKDKLRRFGVVSVCEKRFVEEEYDPLNESGFDFCYEKKSVWGVFAAIVKVLETYKFKFDWKYIVGKVMGK